VTELLTDELPSGPSRRPPSHLDLLDVAREVRRAAVADDLTGVHRELSRLRTDLVSHLHAERDRLGSLAGATPVVVADGHRRLLRLLDDLLFRSGGDTSECSCIVRSAELEVALRRQAKLEAVLLGERRRS